MPLNRRKFLTNTSLLLAGTGLTGALPLESLAFMRKYIAPSDRIHVGLIGCNGMGFADLSSILKNSEVNVKAICDIDDNVLQKRSADLEKAGIKKPVWYK